MANERIWVRCGDRDDYHDFEDLDDAADYLSGCYARPPLAIHCKFGVRDGGRREEREYDNDNYISLYFGDENADPIRKLKGRELAALNSLLKEYSQSHLFF